MRLSTLVATLDHHRLGPATDPEISAVTHDSRAAGKGTLFAAFPGMKADGRAFLAEAVSRGAEAALGLAPPPEPLGVPYLAVASPRRAAGLLAARLAGEPADKLVLVGITGTSGKTTTTLLLDRLLEGRHAIRGLFGTLVYRGAGAPVAAARTTPEATDLQPMLAALVAGGGTAAVMECSSHALVLERLAGCRFDAAVFLNLSRDHLDFHEEMEAYFEAKRLLFSMVKPSGAAVIHLGDPFGRRLAESLEGGRKITFALGAEADVTAEADLTPTGTVLHISDRISGTEYYVTSPLLGRPNAENLLAAAATGSALGFSPAEIAPALGSVDRIPGRMEPVPNTRGLTVLVDYAHKPGALEGALQTTRSLASSSGGRVVVVFGCGGDRDRGKRPEMGRIAAELADVVIVTSDNPRSEPPEAILDEIRRGVPGEARADVTYDVDRRRAIALALQGARPGDVVLIAGKGHETYQETAGKKELFDDRVVAEELLGDAPWT